MEKILPTKSKSQYDNQISKVLFHLLKFNHALPKVMGSNSVNGLNNSLDYDLFTVVKSHSSLEKLKKLVVKEFVDMCKQIKKNPDWYFIELMCGVDKDNNPLYWSLNDVMKKEKDGYKLIDVLDEKSVIKIEMVIFVNGLFIPISNVYEFRKSDGTGINREQETKDSVDSLKVDVKKYYEKKNYMKCLKRILIISIVQKDNSMKEKILEILNTDISKIYFVKSELETVIAVLENYTDKMTLERAYSIIQSMKEKVGNQTLYEFDNNTFKLFDEGSKSRVKKCVKVLEKINKKLVKIVNKLLLKQKINIKKYL